MMPSVAPVIVNGDASLELVGFRLYNEVEAHPARTSSDLSPVN